MHVGTPVRHRALVVDDDPDVADLVVMVLEGLDLDVRVAATGRAAVEAARELEPDLVTLDLGLPDRDGTDVCRELRGFTDAYIVMITGREAEVDRLVGLEVGADEYLVKPFSPRELRARAAALLRRPRAGATGGPSAVADAAAGGRAPGTPVERLVDLGGGLVLDPVSATLAHQEEPVPLTPTEVRVLTALARAPGHARDRGELVQEVWQGDFIESDFLVDVQVAGLRRKLREATGRDWVAVVAGSAYRLVPPT